MARLLLECQRPQLGLRHGPRRERVRYRFLAPEEGVGVALALGFLERLQRREVRGTRLVGLVDQAPDVVLHIYKLAKVRGCRWE